MNSFVIILILAMLFALVGLVLACIPATLPAGLGLLAMAFITFMFAPLIADYIQEYRK